MTGRNACPPETGAVASAVFPATFSDVRWIQSPFPQATGMTNGISQHRRWPLHGFAGVGAGFGLLDAQLVAVGLANPLGLLSLVAWLFADGRCPHLLAKRYIAFQPKSPSLRSCSSRFPFPAGGFSNCSTFARRTGSTTGAEYFTDVQYFALCSLSFSTVMPAVFGTAGTGRHLRLAAKAWRAAQRLLPPRET